MRGLPIRGLVLLASLCAGIPFGHAANMVLKLEGDPESYFEVPDADSLDAQLQTAFTVEAWVNPEILDVENLVVNKEDVYEIGVNNGTFQTAIQPEGQGWAWMDSLESVPEGEWTHIAAAWDGSLVSLFVNGTFTGSFDLFGDAVHDSPDTLKVGRRTRGGDTHSIFTGLIDEVRISKVVRYTEAGFEVPRTAFVADADTVALYHFDQQVGDIVQDASSFGNDGVLLNDARLVPDDFLLPATQFLMAGDADMDLDFDQLDLVRVQIAARYLTGQPATWGDGDWNGAPGGSPGDPPTGNGLFDQLDIIAALGPGHYLTGPYQAITGDGTRGDGQTSIVYDARTGEVAVDAPSAADSLAGGGALGNVDLTYVPVPEPSSVALLSFALILGRLFHRRS